MCCFYKRISSAVRLLNRKLLKRYHGQTLYVTHHGDFKKWRGTVKSQETQVNSKFFFKFWILVDINCVKFYVSSRLKRNLSYFCINGGASPNHWKIVKVIIISIGINGTMPIAFGKSPQTVFLFFPVARQKVPKLDQPSWQLVISKIETAL